MVQVGESDLHLPSLGERPEQLHGVRDQRVLDLRHVPVGQLVWGVEGGVKKGLVDLILLDHLRQGRVQVFQVSVSGT